MSRSATAGSNFSWQHLASISIVLLEREPTATLRVEFGNFNVRAEVKLPRGGPCSAVIPEKN